MGKCCNVMSYIDIYLGHKTKIWKELDAISEIEEIVFISDPRTSDSELREFDKRILVFDSNKSLIKRTHIPPLKTAAIHGEDFIYKDGFCVKISKWAISNNVFSINEHIIIGEEILVEKNENREVWDILSLREKKLSIVSRKIIDTNPINNSVALKVLNSDGVLKWTEIYYYDSNYLLIKEEKIEGNLDKRIIEKTYSDKDFLIKEDISLFKSSTNKTTCETKYYTRISKDIGNGWIQETNCTNGDITNLTKRKYYFIEEQHETFDSEPQNQISIMKRQNLKYALLSLLVIYLCVILFLLALNGRYDRLANKVVLDKWKKEVIIIGSDELPLKYN